jgi:hypothetical protein
MKLPCVGLVCSSLLSSCAQESASPGPDGPHYLASLEAEDSENAAEACFRIQATELQSECVLHVAGKAARAGEDALSICTRIQHQGWRQACHFEVADAAGLVEDEAIAACTEAPDFIERCLSHAIVRHAGRVANRFSLGEEAQFTSWIQDQADVYGLESSERVIADVLAQHISSRACASRESDQPCPPFALEDCGAAPMDICRQAYRVTARSASRGIDLSSICSRPIHREGMESAGLPVWKDDFTRPAIETWGHICQAMTGQTPPPGPALLHSEDGG